MSITTSNSTKLLKRIHRHLTQLLADTQLKGEDPFEVLWEERTFPTEMSAKYLWNDIYEYYKVTENWQVEGSFSGFERLPSYVFELAKAHGVSHIDSNILREVGGYLESQWLVFVPMIRTHGMIFQKSLTDQHIKIGPNLWITEISSNEEDHYKWIYKKFKNFLPKAKRKNWLDKASTFHHQLCQIGGGKYGPDKKTAKGHYLIFRLSGSLRDIDSKLDPSAFFIFFSHALRSIEKKGKFTSDFMPTSASELEPDGLIGVSLKDFTPWRFQRNALMSLNIVVNDLFVKTLNKNNFDKIAKKIFSNKRDKRWNGLKDSADVLYQYIENEQTNGYAYTRKSVSTVLLCSAAEAMLQLDKNKPIKKNMSTLIASVLQPNDGAEYNKIHELLDSAYKARSNFVHKGNVDWVDNQLLHSYIVTAWMKAAEYYLKSNSENRNLVTLVKKSVSKKSKIFRQSFYKDYLGTDLG